MNGVLFFRPLDVSFVVKRIDGHLNAADGCSRVSAGHRCIALENVHEM